MSVLLEISAIISNAESALQNLEPIFPNSASLQLATGSIMTINNLFKDKYIEVGGKPENVGR